LPTAAEKPKSFENFFVGTSNDASDGIAAVEERRFLVLSRIHSDTTSDKIVNFQSIFFIVISKGTAKNIVIERITLNRESISKGKVMI
jgi:hypothetical protein